MDRDSRCVVTEMPFRGKRFRVLLVTDEKGRECEILCEDTATRSLVGDIYTGKVERVMKGIRAAFVKIAGGRTVFLPLEDAVGASTPARKANGRNSAAETRSCFRSCGIRWGRRTR